MFAPHLYGLRRFHRLHLHRLGHIAGPVLEFTDGLARRSGWGPRRGFRAARRGPSMVTLLLAGLAVLALVKVMSAAGGRRSRAEKLVLGGVIVVLAAVVMSFRRSSARYRR
jgi:hypothetical protein